MGKGRELGLRLRSWIDADAIDIDSRTALTSALLDLLGEEETLQGPVRDLTSQPLLRQALLQGGSQQRSAVTGLVDHLSRTYAPRVLAELLELLEAATGVPIDGAPHTDPGPGKRPSPPRPFAPGPMSEPTILAESVLSPPSDAALPAVEPAERSTAPVPTTPGARARSILLGLQPIAPGVLLAFCAALVLSWAAGELQRLLLEPLNWSSGAILALVLAVLQLVAIGPFAPLLAQATLDPHSARDPRLAWRWITAPWVHRCRLEGTLNILVLLVPLGPSPLPLSQMVLRYCLTALATLALAEQQSRRVSRHQIWCGASGVVAALITLGVALSLLHGQPRAYLLGPLAIPAWVLMLVFGALQLRWILPRQSHDDRSTPAQRLLASQWWWGTVLGATWAVVTWLQELLRLGGKG